MEPENQTDHIALLALMICGTLIKRLDEVGHLDEATARRLHRLVEAVRTHAKRHNAADLKILFDNIDLSIGDKPRPSAVSGVDGETPVDTLLPE